jgi:hypothetical protein
LWSRGLDKKIILLASKYGIRSSTTRFVLAGLKFTTVVWEAEIVRLSSGGDEEIMWNDTKM